MEITITNEIKIRSAKDFNEALVAFRHACETCLDGQCGKCCPMERIFRMQGKRFGKDDPAIAKKVEEELG